MTRQRPLLVFDMLNFWYESALPNVNAQQLYRIRL